MSDEVELKLTEDEAWVLFDFVRRYSETDRLSIEDQAEQRALWNLCCVFEKTLHQTEDIDYQEFLAQRRDRLRDES
ncbi:hypothetical protein [Marinobacter nauticus]|uniref:hypothetical protein n=1 Tax=Marinobacter nauticus TaxID=2743 RepID=UPI0037350A8A